jgi:hypothetical protein
MGIDFCVTINAEVQSSFEAELRQILSDLGLQEKVTIG